MTGKILYNRAADADGRVFDMMIWAPEAAAVAEPGQFLHISCPGVTLLRRPISICEFDRDKGTIRICYEVKGAGTSALSGAKSGEELDFLGPLGHGFDCRGEGETLLVGGGIGVFPLLAAAGCAGSATALFGFRSASAVCLTDDFKRLGTVVEIITDDGSSGRRGFVTELLSEALRRNPARVLACGPAPMLRAVAAMCEESGVPCQVSLEERMGCGVGACMACACKIKSADGFTYKRVCADGPVFDSGEVIF